MSRKENEEYVDKILKTYVYHIDNQSFDDMEIMMLEHRIFKAIRGLQKLPFSFSNKWYAFKTKRKLQGIYIELHYLKEK